MRIYVACLASYNAGTLYGSWIDLDGLYGHEVRSEIARMLRGSPNPNVTVACPWCSDPVRDVRPLGMLCTGCNNTGKVPSAEEWAVHDYDDVPGEWGEHPDLDKLCEFMELLDGLEDSERGAYLAYREYQGNEPDVDAFRDAYAGEHSSWEDFAAHYVEESGLLQDVPDAVSRYFDYEAYGRDMRLGGDAHEVDGFYFWTS